MAESTRAGASGSGIEDSEGTRRKATDDGALRRACDSCTRRKNKCSRELPCSVCLRIGARCEYSTALKRGRRTRTGSTGRSTSAEWPSGAQALQLPVPCSGTANGHATLQEQQEPTTWIPRVVPAASPTGPDRSPSSVLQLISKSGPHMVSFQALIEASSVSEVPSAGLQNSDFHGVQTGHASAGEALQPLRELSREDSLGTLAFPRNGSEHQQPWQDASAQIASTPTSPEWTRREEELYRVYWAIVHPLWPLIFRPAVDERVIRQQRPLLHHAMMALACERAENISDHDPFDYKSFGEVHAQQFRNLFDFHSHVPRVATIQALLLMSFREVQKDAGLTGWNYLGLATRYATTLSLHLKSRSNLPDSPMEQEASRVIWCCYVAEQWSSLALGKPCSIRAANISRPLPSVLESDEYGFWATDARGLVSPQTEQALQGVRCRTISNFRNWAALMQILEEIIVFTTSSSSMPLEEKWQGLGTIGQKLSQWQSEHSQILADNIASAAKDPPHMIDVCLRYHTCVIILHRPLIAETAPTHQQGRPAASAFEACISAADATINLFQQYETTVGSLRRASAAFVFMLLQAGLVYIAAFSSDDMTISKLGGMQLYQCLKSLKKMAYSYGSASKFVDFLQSWAMRLRLSNGRDTLRSRAVTPDDSITQLERDIATASAHTWVAHSENQCLIPDLQGDGTGAQETDLTWLFNSESLPVLNDTHFQSLPTDLPDLAQWLNLPAEYDTELLQTLGAL